ncbi:MAG: 50S ribosomal protein L24 [Tissierellia bacterium]|nr:50S ribosomal protein L24 [Tissierellia bacterium]
MRLKKGDTVKVIAGKDKGKVGKILKTEPQNDRVVVEGINMITKHKKTQSPQKPGGIMHYEAPIHVSNVMIYEGNKVSRVGYDVSGKEKVRVAKKTGTKLDK